VRFDVVFSVIAFKTEIPPIRDLKSRQAEIEYRKSGFRNELERRNTPSTGIWYQRGGVER
jgi:hypothetical protein